MAEEKKFKRRWEGDIPSITTTFKGTFDFKELLLRLKDILLEKGYSALEDIAPKDSFETMYLEKGKPKTNYVIMWELKNDKAKYIRYSLKIEFKGLGVEETEIAWEGQKLTICKGEMIVKIMGELIPDKDKEWEKHWALKNFINFYELKVYKKELDFHKEKVKTDMQMLNDIVKRFFKLLGKEPDIPLPPHV